MLKIKNLTATAQDHEVLKNIDLEVKQDEIHAIIGPSGAGKTALMFALAGLPYIEISEGSIHFKNKKINKQKMHERSLSGIATVFQDLIEVPSTTNWDLLENILKFRKDKRDLSDLRNYYIELCISLDLGLDHGDKSADSDSMTYDQAIKNELLIASVLDANLTLIDSIDEKLNDEDKKLIAGHIAEFAHSGGHATIMFSKDKTVLEAINPTHVHVMVDGKLILSGGKELLQRIEEDGYSELSTS